MVSADVPSTTGVILAGGRSSRYGADKCFASWNGKPFIVRVADAMRPHVDRLVVASRCDVDPVAYASAVPDASVLPDPTPFPGPVDGLRRALASDDSQRVIVAGCDSPALSPVMIGRLLAATSADVEASVLVVDGSVIHSVFVGSTRVIRARCRDGRLRSITSGAAHVIASGAGFNVNHSTRRSSIVRLSVNSTRRVPCLKFDSPNGT